MFYYLLVVFCRFWKFPIALLCIVLEECRGTALGWKAARTGVFFDTYVMRRSRMQLVSLEHTRVRTAREIFASSGCESAGALRFLASKCTAGNVALRSVISAWLGAVRRSVQV